MARSLRKIDLSLGSASEQLVNAGQRRLVRQVLTGVSGRQSESSANIPQNE